MKAITVNIGSRSKKYSYYEDDSLVSSFEVVPDQEASFDQFVSTNNIAILETIVGIRIVAPGSIFCEHSPISNEYLDSLRASQTIAPLHTEAILKEIDAIRATYPDVKIFALSDSAFHKSIPDYLRFYAIPQEMREKYSIIKQGYHGLSLSSIVSQLSNNLGSIPEKLVVAHLGGGSSVTAILNGASIDTSMGFTPLDGIPMAERVGSIDAGALLHIGRSEAMDYGQLLHFISHSSGLEALTHVEHGDLKEIIEHSENQSSPKHESCVLAINMYTSAVAKQIAAMTVALGGIDTLVFTGTVGELSAPIRAKVVSHLAHLNIVINIDKNLSVSKSDEILFIHNEEHNTKCAVIFTNESKEMQTILKQFAAL